jgi:putative oxidoreductase
MSRYGATVLRVILGVIFVMNGYFALFVLEPAGAAQAIKIPGLPLGEALAWYLIVAHIAGGLMLIVGLKTRWAAVANIPVILIALSMVHAYQSFLMTCVVVDAAAGKAHPAGLEYPLLVLAATAALALQGGGALAMTDDREPLS